MMIWNPKKLKYINPNIFAITSYYCVYIIFINTGLFSIGIFSYWSFLHLGFSPLGFSPLGFSPSTIEIYFYMMSTMYIFVDLWLETGNNDAKSKAIHAKTHVQNEGVCKTVDREWSAVFPLSAGEWGQARAGGRWWEWGWSVIWHTLRCCSWIVDCGLLNNFYLLFLFIFNNWNLL